MVYNDLNNSDSIDPGEPGVISTKVYLDLNRDGEGGGGDKVVYTDKDGKFTFTGLQPGTYVLLHIANNGYFTLSPPGGGQTVVLPANAGVANLYFGDSDHVLGGFGFVTGRVFNDDDGDGFWDPGEAGLGGRTLFIDLDKNGAFDLGEPLAVSDPEGRYTIPHVPSGQTRMLEILPPGWAATNDSTQILNLLPGYTLTRNFGSRPTGVVTEAAAEEQAVPISSTMNTSISSSTTSVGSLILSADGDETLA